MLVITLDDADPHLAAVRSLAASLAQQAQAIEQARFNLYKAIRDGDARGARSWLNTLALAVTSGVNDSPALRRGIDEAVDALRQGLR